MSAINVIRHPDAVHLITDAAQYMADGTLGMVGQKVLPLAHLDAVLAARGPKLLLPFLGDHIGSQFSTFDELKAGLVESLMLGFGAFADVWELCDHGISFDLVVAGFSSQGPDSFLVANHDRYGVPAWRINQLGPVGVMPADEATMVRIALTEAEAAGWLDPVVDGLRIIEAQRYTVARQGSGQESAHGVGGFAQLTTVTRNGIETRILRRWPDRIGEKLGTRLPAPMEIAH